MRHHEPLRRIRIPARQASCRAGIWRHACRPDAPRAGARHRAQYRCRGCHRHSAECRDYKTTTVTRRCGRGPQMPGTCRVAPGDVPAVLRSCRRNWGRCPRTFSRCIRGKTYTRTCRSWRRENRAAGHDRTPHSWVEAPASVRRCRRSGNLRVRETRQLQCRKDFPGFL